jgi:hypothetical protein
MPTWALIVLGVLGLLVIVAIYDVTQRRHAILRNFPIVGHFRYLFELVGPELRQYIVTGNDEERPFSRDQRRWVYASSKRENNYFGFGTDNDLEQAQGYIIIRHAAFPLAATIDPEATVPCAKVLGAARGRAKRLPPHLDRQRLGDELRLAVVGRGRAFNQGVAIAGALQNTGEGGISDHHRAGGDLIWQIGTGYFGCRDADGRFAMDRFLATVASAPVRAIELKLSQGAKPGMGGLLPAAKVTPEIARIRGVPLGKDVHSPAGHTAFTDVSSMLDFIERLADATGLPVGIKSAVGELGFWRELARQMRTTGRGPDFITIDGGEGGTGAAPWSSPTTSRCRGSSASPRSTAPWPRTASPRTWSSSARASSASPRPRSWRWRWAAIWSTSPARPSWRSAASRPSAATPATARPGSRPRTAGCARPRPDAQERAPGQLPARPAQGSAPARPRLRPGPPGAGAPRSPRSARRPGPALGPRRLRLRPDLGPAAGPRSRGDRGAHGRRQRTTLTAVR